MGGREGLTNYGGTEGERVWTRRLGYWGVGYWAVRGRGCSRRARLLGHERPREPERPLSIFVGTLDTLWARALLRHFV